MATIKINNINIQASQNFSYYHVEAEKNFIYRQAPNDFNWYDLYNRNVVLYDDWESRTAYYI